MAKNVIFNMAAAAILHCYLVTLDHPRSLLRYGHLKILQIWLKTLIPAPIFAFLGVLTPKRYFSSSGPSKGTSLGESASFKVYIVKIRPPVFRARVQACRGYGYPWIYPCVDMRLRPGCGYIHGLLDITLAQHYSIKPMQNSSKLQTTY